MPQYCTNGCGVSIPRKEVRIDTICTLELHHSIDQAIVSLILDGETYADHLYISAQAM